LEFSIFKQNFKISANHRFQFLTILLPDLSAFGWCAVDFAQSGFGVRSFGAKQGRQVNNRLYSHFLL